MMSKKLNKKALAATGLALALSIGATQLPQTQVVFHAPFQAKKAYASERKDYTIRTQSDLDNFFKMSDHDQCNFTGFIFENKGTITFPKNTQLNIMRHVVFKLSDKSTGTINFNGTTAAINHHAKGSVRPADGHAYWPTTAKLDWYISSDHKNQVIENLDVHGSVEVNYANGKVQTDNQGGTQVILLHAKNINFQNMQFHQAQTFDRHVFDVLGSSNVTWHNCKFYGYGGKNFNQSTWNAIYKQEANSSKGVGGHSVLSEAIQLDVATPEGASYDSNVNSANFPSAGSKLLDGASTQNATIKNCYFGPEINCTSGGAIVNRDPKKAMPKTTIPYGATVGSHGVDDAHKIASYKNISIYNSTFENTANATNVKLSYYKVMAPIHLRYTARQSTSDVNSLKAWNNTFKNVINRGDNGIPDTLSGQGQALSKTDIWLYKSWAANAPVYLATTSTTFPKLNSHGSKITKAVLASSAAKKKTVKRTNAQVYAPKAKSITVKAGSKLAAKSLITNASKLPAKTSYAFSPAPNLKKAGTYTVSVLVTYPDNSKDTVKNVKVKVTAVKKAAKKATKKTTKKSTKKTTKKTTKKSTKKTTKKTTKKSTKKTAAKKK